MTGTILIALQEINIRRGPTTNSSSIGKLSHGQQLPVVGSVIPGRGAEEWVQVDYPAARPAAAYVCVRLVNGRELASLRDGAATGGDPDTYNRGYMDGRSATLRELAQEIQEKLQG